MVHINRSPDVRFDTNTEMVHCVGMEVGALGACNFNYGQLTQLPNFCWTNNLPRPAVVQNELHPLLLTREVRDLCKRVGIVSQAYASKGTGSLGLMDDGVVEVVASKIEHGCVLLSESAREERMKTSRDICVFMPCKEDVEQKMMEEI